MILKGTMGMTLKKSFFPLSVFFLDFYALLLFLILFSPQVYLLSGILFLTLGIPYDIPVAKIHFAVCFIILLAYNTIRILLRARHTKAARSFEAFSFVTFTLVGAAACFLSSRLIFLHASFPRLFAVLLVLFAAVFVWHLPRRLLWRKVSLFLAIIINFNCAMAFISRRNISVTDLLPPESPAVQVVAGLPGYLETAAKGRILSSFAGVLIPSQQYLYVTLDAREEFLLASDFGFFNKKGTLSKIRLDDYAVVSSFEKGDYFGRMAHHEKSNQFVSTVWSTEKGLLYFLDAADLAQIASVDLEFQTLMSLGALRGESTLVTSEQGWIAVLDSDRNMIRKVQLPITPQGMSLDRTKNIAAIGSGSGTLVTLNAETLEVLKKRLVSIYSCGVDIDPKGNRIFMPRTILGDLLVFDEHTLETIARIPLEPGVRVVRYITDRQLVVVGNYLNGKLYFVDTEDYRLIDTLWVGSKIRSIQYAPTRDRLYISTALRILEVDPNKL